MTAPQSWPEEHPLRKDGVTPYDFGGYAFLKLGCRCAGCLAAQKATSEKAAANRQHKKSGRATEKLSSPTPVTSVVNDVLGDVKPTVTKAPGGASAKQVEHAFAQVLVYMSIGFVWVAARGLPLSDDQTDQLALADDEAATIAAPLARVFATSDLNTRYGRQLVDNSDVLEAVFVFGAYMKRTTKVLTQIRVEVSPARPATPAPQPNGGPYGAAPAGPDLRVVREPDPAPRAGAGGSDDPEFSPPRPTYEPYEPGSQLSSD